ncbi:MFS transporter [Nonomuraea longicatena]|uniref:MFS transporter n=1 Tax=Nonomuraea longicatena TaxID=83682 RepID=A0ABN1Q4M1_9ACTN
MSPSDQRAASGSGWTPDFTRFFLARTTSVAGDMMLPVALTAAMVQNGYGATGVGYALAAQIAPLAIFVVFGGVLVDRFGARRMMAGADLGRLLVQGVLAASFFVTTPPLWLVLVLLVLVGLGTAAFQPGVATVIPQVAADVQRANATLRVAESLMTVLGPALAGLLLTVSTPATVLAVDAATFAVSGLCLLSMRTRLQVPRRGRPAPLSTQLVEGWHHFRARPWLWGVILIWMFGALTAFGPHQTLGAAVITTTHGTAAFGLVMAMLGAGSVVGGLLAARIRPRHPLRAGACAMAGFVLAPLVVALDLPVPLLAAGHAVAGASVAFWLVMFHTSVQTHIPPAVLARVHAYDVAGSLVMQPVGRAVAGPVSQEVGVQPYLLFSSAMIVVVVALLLASPAIRDLRRADAPTPDP